MRLRGHSALMWAMRLRACYAMSGTELGYGATQVGGEDCTLEVGPATRAGVSASLSAYACATRCPVLTSAMLLPGGCRSAEATVGYAPIKPATGLRARRTPDLTAQVRHFWRIFCPFFGCPRIRAAFPDVCGVFAPYFPFVTRFLALL
eukprot:3940391-Rhodomonas_salina.5